VDAIALTRTLLQFDTVNPPGRERDCARHAGAMLEQWGYKVEYHEYADRRTSVIARAGGREEKAPLCLTGHLDVVPLGTRKWAHDPFSGETAGDRLYGRGSSDMKAGVAAILVAARSMADKLPGTPGVVIVLTAAEEGGCIGSKKLAETQLLGRAGAIVVGEPTSNYPLVGHKGSIKFHASFRGVSAHGSMPQLGENAVYKAARAVAKLEAFVPMYNDLMLAPSGLTKLEREMIAVAVSSQNHCYYCVVAHGAAVRALSANPELGEQIAINYRAASLDARQRGMLDFAVKLTIAPSTVDEEDRAKLRALGFTDRDIWDIAAVAAFFNMSNRLASATDMRPNAEYHRQAR